MPESSHIAVVRRLYDARGNPDIIRPVLAPDIRWEVVEGFPYGGVYVGLDDVVRNFRFTRTASAEQLQVRAEGSGRLDMTRRLGPLWSQTEIGLHR